MLKAIHPSKDIAAARGKSLPVIEKLRASRLNEGSTMRGAITALGPGRTPVSQTKFAKKFGQCRDRHVRR